MRLQDRILRGVLQTGGTSALGIVGALARTAIVARVVPTEDIGLYAMLLIGVGFGSLLGALGLGGALYHYAELRWRDFLRGVGLAAATATALGLGIGWGLGATAAFAGVPTVALALATAAACGGQVVGELAGVRLSLWLAYGTLARLNLLSRLLGDGLAVAIVLIEPTALGLALGLGAAGLLSAGVVGLGTWRYYRALAPAERPAAHTPLRPLLRLGLLNVSEGLLNYAVFRLDRLIVTYAYGLGALGAYELVAQLVERPFVLLAASLRGVYGPLFSRFLARPTALRTVHDSYMGAVGLVALPICALSLALAPDLLGLILGVDYASAWPVFASLAVLSLYKATSLPVSQYLVAAGRLRLSLAFNGVVGAVRLGALLVAALALPIGGAFAVYVAARITASVGFETVIRRRLLRLDLARAYRPLRPHVGRALLAGLAAVAVLYVLAAATPTPHALATALAAGIFALVYASTQRERLRAAYAQLSPP